MSNNGHRQLTLEDWEAAAPPVCSICGAEMFQMTEAPWGEKVCPRCFNDPICPHVRQSRYASILVATGLRVCRLCQRLERAQR